MPESIRVYIQHNQATFQDFELALVDRVNEGQFNVANGQFTPGVMLLGHAVEILLKMSYVRIERWRRNVNPSFQIRPMLHRARVAGETLIPGVDPEGFHSVRFWAMLIQATRAGQARPLGDSVALPFEACTERLHNNWSVEMRYLSSRTSREEAIQVLSDLGWLRAHEHELWR